MIRARSIELITYHSHIKDAVLVGSRIISMCLNKWVIVASFLSEQVA